MKVGWLFAGRDHRLAQLDRTGAAFRPVVGHDGIVCAGCERLLAHQVHFGVGVGVEAIDGHDDRHAKAAGVVDMRGQIGATCLQQFQIFSRCRP